MPFLTTCDPALRDQCGAWKDPQAVCACGWAPNLARGVCREMHETETTEETA